MLSLLCLAAVVAAAPAAEKVQSPPPAIPLHFKYGDYPRVSADILWGSPAQQNPISTVVDTGSADFWVYGPNATINSGSNYLFVPGPCNDPVKPFYNWPHSTTHSKKFVKQTGYAYGGNGKIVAAYYQMNDTIGFANQKYPAINNNRVAVANYTILKQTATTCDGSTYDHSILGLSPATKNSAGPSYRQDLLDAGEISSSTFSMWFDANPDDVKADFRGTLLFGAVPNKTAKKYSGDLVHLAPNPPPDTYIGYYVSLPKILVAPTKNPKAKKEVKQSPYLTTPVAQCLVDSGTGNDNLPISQDDFNSITGLIYYQGYIAYNGSCESIPKTATIDYQFTGLNKKNVTVSVPLRNYARGNADYLGNPNICGLSIQLDEPECVLGAPFFTAAFLAFNDEKNQIAIAQGGVSTGSLNGQAGLKDITVVKKGAGLP